MQGLPWIAAACVATVSLAAAPVQQKPAARGSDLPPLPNALEVKMMLDKDQWNQVALFKRQYELKSADKAIVDLANFQKTETVEVAKRDAVRTYEPALVNALTALGKTAEPTRFVYVSGDVPVVFGMNGPDLAVVITGLVSSKTYNTAKVTAAQRGGEVIRTMAFPSLKAFSAFDKAPAVKWFGVAVVYGTRDFGGDAASEAESVALIVPSEQCRGWLAGKVEEGALFESGEVFLSDRDAAVGLKRFKPTAK